MNPFQHINQPGVYQVDVSGLAGRLEVELMIPESTRWDKMALLGHPHSLHGGTMHNKVVSTMVRAYKEAHIPAIRFNFRGVGRSEGEYDAGVGESNDMLYLAELWKQLFPQVDFSFAGFSYGSYVAYRAAALHEQQHQQATHLITIAPSVVHYNYAEFDFDSVRWTIFQGEADEIVSAQAVYDFAASKDPAIRVINFEHTGHFFHGKLIELKDGLIEMIHLKS